MTLNYKIIGRYKLRLQEKLKTNQCEKGKARHRLIKDYQEENKT